VWDFRSTAPRATRWARGSSYPYSSQAALSASLGIPRAGAGVRAQALRQIGSALVRHQLLRRSVPNRVGPPGADPVPAPSDVERSAGTCAMMRAAQRPEGWEGRSGLEPGSADGEGDVRAARPGVDEAARRRGLRVLLVATFFAWAGFFLVVPLLSVHYVDGLGWAASAIGLVLAVRQFLQQGLTTVGGVLADRWGPKGLIAGGMLVRAVGFAGIAWADRYAWLMAATVLAAIGGALFESPRSAAIAALTEPEERPRYYALAGVAGGLGITVGTQLGALLLRVDFALVSLAAASCYVLIWALVVAGLPPVRVSSGSGRALDGIGRALRDRPFMTYNALMMGHWFVWTQYYISLPLAATALTGRADAVAWVYGLNAAITLALGYPLPRLAQRRLSPPATLVLGAVLASLGLGAIGFVSGTNGLLAAVAVFSIGVVLVRPSEQTVAAGLADPAVLGSYFGVASLSLAVGGGVGNWAGGVLYDLGQRLDRPALPWLLIAAVGLASAAGLWWTMARADRSVREPGSPDPETSGEAGGLAPSRTVDRAASAPDRGQA